MTLVASGLYLGDYKNASDFWWLKEKGVSTIINAAEEVPNYYPSHFNYINLNMEDVPEYPIELPKFEGIFRFIKEQRYKGRVTLVHCRAGVNRSAIMVLYFIMRNYNIDYNDAFEVLYRLRPIINPHPVYIEYASYAKMKFTKQ
jgi:atypical dual specificity phosphatase